MQPHCLQHDAVAISHHLPFRLQQLLLNKQQSTTMKKILLLISGVFGIASAQAQIGINTENPRGALHIDAASSTATTNPSSGTITAAQALDDVIIDSRGNVGIGTVNPTQKLEIQTGGTAANPVTGFKLADGSQGADKVLTSDANGIGIWKSGNLLYSDILYVDGLKAAFKAFEAPSPYANYVFGRCGTILNSNGTPYCISLPGTGVYQLSISVRFYFNTTAMTGHENKVESVVASLMTNSNINIGWTENRFRGSFEQYGISMAEVSPNCSYAITINQTIAIDTVTGNNVYIGLSINSNTNTTALPVTFDSRYIGIGNGAPTLPQRQGGSWVKIKDL